ncbi:3-ketoacyl-CoA-synthase [Reticulomyxa filosa]|uniref:beta-ketoacyl-[acyl-carrier-protein] synthase I n=1 Tax=Reticulomyxa filosa TaxID=46433 RepID=X6MPZ8_RETFI|nr:3-ketoacyl-CoA-synthase [Reticulomyxa filosa]|eukprot:ETO15894.1 3-ketoacyl-CoA-synthase [Reticulomyxa filosa]
MGGPELSEAMTIALQQQQRNGYRQLGPFDLPNALTNTSAGAISSRYGLHGPSLCPASACAAGAHAIMEAYALIAMGQMNVMIAGGADASIVPWGVGGFARCKALACKFNDNPSQASRPFDVDRCGFVIGEGAATLILEEYDHATQCTFFFLKKKKKKKKRGAPIYAELVGIASTCDAFHMTAPEPSGKYIRRCMDLCIEHAAACTRSDVETVRRKIGYVNAHATSTPIGDSIELNAILQCILDLQSANDNAREKLIKERLKHADLKISATKGSIGHLLGAAGAIEACFSVQTLVDQIAPPTLNLLRCDEEFEADGVRHLLCANASHTFDGSKYTPCDFALSNSFGFGGTNASLLFCKVYK